MQPKKETRIIAWDDCAFRYKQKKVLVVGIVFRGGSFLDGVLSTSVKKDGTDATEKIINAVKKSRHHDQLSVIMTNGLTFAGLNVVDIKKLSTKTGLPVIAVQRKKPDMKGFLLALKKTKDHRKKAVMVRNAGRVYAHNEIFFQRCGIKESETRKILDLTCTRSKIPEPLRVAHLIAGGVSRRNRDKDTNFMESKGGA